MYARDLYSLPESLQVFAPFFSENAAPWQWLPMIEEALESEAFDPSIPENVPGGLHINGPVYLHPSVKLPPYGVIEGPAWIGPNCELRPGVYIRGRVIVGAGCVLGNSCEYKNCLLLDGVETPHYNYVGDSVLGNRAHLGAGAICANLKLSREEISVRLEGGLHRTGLRKVGAFLGDQAEASCNSVLQPGTIIGKGSAVLAPSFHGFLPAGKMALAESEVKIRRLPFNRK